MVKRIVKYNPAFLSRDELVQSFVVRHAELELIVQVIRENLTQSNQHVLVIGPRGAGKTMLALRVAEEVRKEGDLNERWYPLVFSEESYQVTTPGEFWLEALFHLGQKTGESRWKDTFRELTGEQDETRLRERALAQLMDFADEQEKRILLIVENFHMLLGEQISDKDGWALRHTLLNEPRVMLLATATSRFQEIDNSDKPMFELFRTVELEPLDEDQSRTLWASVTGNEPDDERVRPIQILTGGNPRLLTIISAFASRMSLRELMDDLLHLVDEHTEYFKSHLDGLPPTERKVYLGLAELWAPATAREVADAARLNVNKTSSLLRRLIERGAVVLADGKKRTKLYQLAERMYNVYYLMRRRGAPSRRVRALVNFLIGFYGQEQLVELTRRIAGEACRLESPLRQGHHFALEGILETVTSEKLRGIIIRSIPADFLDLADTPASIKRIAGIEGMKEVQMLLEGNEDLCAIKNELEEAEKLFRKVVDANPGDLMLLALHAALMSLIDRHEEAETLLAKAIETAPRGQGLPAVYMLRGAVLDEQGRYVEAEAAYREAVQLFDGFTEVWELLGNLLYKNLQHYEEAEKAYRKVVELDSNSVGGWTKLGVILDENLARYDEAEMAYRKVIELGGESATVWTRLGWLLHGKLERYGDAKEAYLRAVELDEKYAPAWIDLGWLHESSGCYDDAEAAYRTAMTLDCPVQIAPKLLITLLLHQGRSPEEALEILGEHLAHPPHSELDIDFATRSVIEVAAYGHGSPALGIVRQSPSAEMLEPLVVGLQMFVGEDVKAAAEIMELGKDVVKRIEQRRDEMQSRIEKEQGEGDGQA